MDTLTIIIVAWFGAYWMGRQRGYREGVHDGVEIEREAWDDGYDDGPDGDGGEPLPRPVALAEVRGINSRGGGRVAS